jgi:aspartyl-tRNA synthetase
MMLHSIYRTHTCNELRKVDVDKTVTLSGWVHVKRDHGGLIFIDLRDNYGITQVVVDPIRGNLKPDQVEKIPLESVITITGKVILREANTARDDIDTGAIEVLADDVIVQSAAVIAPPLQVNKEADFNEDLRLKYRFLDLRRKKMHDTILLRSRIIHWLRNKMVEWGFFEFQTPILTSSSPEGARDFLVPSRLHPGKFYALPQAPQQFKQLLMVAGFDRYFQIAPCFRDEDSRADRIPGEFYQLDVEMSFVEQRDVLDTIEPVVRELFQKFSSKVIETSFPRISYQEAMEKYGTDKPDLRNPLVNSELTDTFKGSNFSIFAKAIAAGSRVIAIPAPGGHDKPRSFFDNMIAFAKENGAHGLAYITFDASNAASGPIAKLMRQDELEAIRKTANVGAGDAVFFCCDELTRAHKLAGIVRTRIGEELGLIADDIYKFCWIVDFPFFEWNDFRWNNGPAKIDFSHNPFSMPQGGLAALDTDDKAALLDIKAWQYDLVCNGIELGSGAIRNHSLEIMYRAFEIVGYDRATVEDRFGGMLQAFKFGAPPHGGLALGLDRMIMLLCDAVRIRDVVAFPVNGNAEDLLMKAPSEVSQQQLKDLHIRVVTSS